MAGLGSECSSRASHPVVLLSVDLACKDSAEWEQHFLKNGLELSGMAQLRRQGGWAVHCSRTARGEPNQCGEWVALEQCCRQRVTGFCWRDPFSPEPASFILLKFIE